MSKPTLRDCVHKNYLHDLGILIKEYALEAKMRKDKTNSEYDTGYTMGFHRIVSLMQQQADAFGIKQTDIGLEGIDADRDLV